jgi:response regulator of citrate/malate metabolism
LVTAEKECDKVIDPVPVGIKVYLVKPVEPEKLCNKIKQVIFGGVA